MHVVVPAPGSILWIRRQRWRVDRARVERGVVRLDVSDRRRQLTFLAPFDRPVAVRQRRRLKHARRQHAVARLAGIAASLASARGLQTTTGAVVDILPYQLEPALAVLDGARRVLIADEVGLGKTIQAGLILAELNAREPPIRALVIVPRGLRDQWLEELSARFHLDAEVADRETLETAARDMAFGSNPWKRSGVRIVSADYLKQAHVLDAIPLAPWDVVVVDEAHDACGRSARYEACAEMAQRARHVVLLTATPHQGDPVRFGRLERLGGLDVLSDDWTIFRRTRAAIGRETRRRIRWLRWWPSTSEAAVLEALEQFEQAVLGAAGRDRRDGALLLLAVFRKRALSTMAALLVSVERRLEWIGAPDAPLPRLDWFQPRLDLDPDGDSEGDDDSTGLTAEIGLPAEVERRWLRRLRALARAAAASDSKVRRLARLVSKSSEPVVVFTEFRHSLDAIARRLGPVGVAILHGGLSSAERRVALDCFVRGDARVLLATDVASQGLNLHTRARWVVSVELPWRPTRIEQRVGRVDRIGQRRSVHASLLVSGHRLEADVLVKVAARALDVRRATGQRLDLLVPPEERAVAHALFTGTPAEWPASPPVETDGRWHRRAVAVGRQVHLRRRFASVWRAPVSGRPRHAWLAGAGGSRLPARRAASGETRSICLVVRVGIGDGLGRVTDEHLVCVTVATPIAELANALTAVTASSRLLTELRERLRARLDRLRRLSVRRAERAIAVDAAILRHLMCAAAPNDVQLGLFDRRSVRALAAGHAAVRHALQELDERAAGWRTTAEVRVHPPTLEAVFVPR